MFRFTVFLICNYEVITEHLALILVGVPILKMLNSYLSSCFLNYKKSSEVKKKKGILSSLIKTRIILQIGNNGIQPLIFLGFGLWFVINMLFGYMIFVCYAHANDNAHYKGLLAIVVFVSVTMTLGVDWTLSYMAKVSEITDQMLSDMRQIITVKSSGNWTRKVVSRKVKAIRPICLEAGFAGNRFVLINSQIRIMYMENMLSKLVNLLISFPTM